MVNTIQDIPLSDISQDTLGRENTVDLIVDSIRNLASASHQCVVYGIYGKWGEGKTSLMHFIKNALLSKGKDNISIVEYNPWLVNNDEALLKEFFKTVLTYPDDNVRKLIKKYGSLAIYASKTILNAVIPGVGETLASGIELAKDAFNDSEDSLSEMKKRVEKAIIDSGHHLVVMIDDVDRLDKEELHTVLKLIRQIADFPNCIYLVAMDVEMVSKAIGDYHASGTEEDGRKFLEKIIQIPITLPQIPEADMRGFVNAELTEILKEYVTKEQLTNIVYSVTPFMRNIRSLKRYCNQLMFVLPHMKDEVNINDLCILEAIKNASVEVYDRIYENKSYLLKEIDSSDYHRDNGEGSDDGERKYNMAIDQITENLSGRLKSLAAKSIDDLFSNRAYDYQEDLDEKRILTAEYFTKYFVQKVPCNVIPDRLIDSIRPLIADGSVYEVVDVIDEWLKRYPASEIKRASLHLIRSFSNAEEINKAASVVARSLSLCSLSKGLPYHAFLDKDKVSSFVPMVVILRYMFAQMEDVVGIRAYDETILDDTLKTIFSEAELNYCMNMLASSKEILNSGTYDGKNALPKLIQRFKALSFDEQFCYSKYLLTNLLIIWQRIDEESFSEYAKELFTNPSMPYLVVFDRMIDGTDVQNDVSNFVNLFYKQIPLINNRLNDDKTGNPFEHQSVKYYSSNYQAIIIKSV